MLLERLQTPSLEMSGFRPQASNRRVEEPEGQTLPTGLMRSMYPRHRKESSEDSMSYFDCNLPCEVRTGYPTSRCSECLPF